VEKQGQPRKTAKKKVNHSRSDESKESGHVSLLLLLCWVLLSFLVDFFGEVFEFLELGFYFCFVVGFAYSVDDLADLGC
jgi:uncharacterized membrane protein